MPTHLHIFSLLGALLMTALTSLLPPLLEALSPAPRQQALRAFPAEVTFARSKSQAELHASKPELPPQSAAPHQTHAAPQLNLEKLPSAEDAVPALAQTPAISLPSIPLATALVPDVTLPGIQANPQAGGNGTLQTIATADASPDSAPRPILQARPVYPYAAKIRGIEGRVLLDFTVYPDGHCGEAQVLSASPAGYFEKAALDAVEQWRFTPALKDGKAVPSRMKIQIAFDLQNP